MVLNGSDVMIAIQRKGRSRIDEDGLNGESSELLPNQQVDGVVHHLVSIGTPEFRALELDDEQDSVREQHTVHP